MFKSHLHHEIVVPSTLSPEARAAFAAQLFKVHSDIFGGVSEEEFLAKVVVPQSVSTEIEVYRDDEGQIVGYCAFHLYQKMFDGAEIAVFRVQAGLLPAYRRSHSTITFQLARVLRHKLLQPLRRTYLLLSPVHPSSYRLLAELLPTVYPNRKYETPAAMQALMDQVAEAMGVGPPVDPGAPFVRYVGWRTLDSEEDARRWTADGRPDVRFYIDANPGYPRGNGLLTLAPMTFANLSVAVARHVGRAISRSADRLASGSGAARPLSRSDVSVRTARATDLVSASEAGTLPGLLRKRIARSSEDIAYEQYDAGTGNWRKYSWREIGESVARWRRGFEREKLAPGDRVAVLMRNCVEWVCFDQAALASGLVVVPLYPVDSADGFAHILTETGARLLLVETADQWQKVADRTSEFPALTTVICPDTTAARGGPEGVPEGVPEGGAGLKPVAIADWLPTGDFQALERDDDPGNLATVIYTSGTTGPPKGVMLSHRNILSVAEAAIERDPIFPNDVFLSFLPLAHVFERVMGYYVPMMAGARVVYARSAETLADDLLIARPTVLLAVPRIFERIHAAVESATASNRVLKMLLRQAERIGWQRFEAVQGRAPLPDLWARAQWAVLGRMFADPVLARLGGRLRLAVSGGAPLSNRVAHLLNALGVPLIEGYGLTEAASTVSADAVERPWPGSAGEPLRGIAIQLSHSGELLVRGPGVMLGYWSQPEQTRTAIDAAGWLHTGDIAESRDGRLFIRGRVKDILVTSTGEKVDRAALEASIVTNPLFEQALLLGEGRPYLAALLILRRAEWDYLAEHLQLDPNDPKSLSDPKAATAALERLTILLKPFPAYAQVRAVHLSLDPWTVAGGLLTPTLKTNRARLEARFASEIRQLYQPAG